MGQYEEAIAANKKAINLWPNYVGAHIGLEQHLITWKTIWKTPVVKLSSE